MGGAEQFDIGDGEMLGDLSCITVEGETGGTNRHTKPNPTKDDILGL